VVEKRLLMSIFACIFFGYSMVNCLLLYRRTRPPGGGIQEPAVVVVRPIPTVWSGDMAYWCYWRDWLYRRLVGVSSGRACDPALSLNTLNAR
jgi:hypothetical protein